MRLRRVPTRVVALAITVIAALTVAAPASSQNGDSMSDSIAEAEQARQDLLEQSIAAAAELDVLAAEDRELVAALEVLEEAVAVASASVAERRDEVADAISNMQNATEMAELFGGDVDQLEAIAEDQAIEAYIARTTDPSSTAFMSPDTLNEALINVTMIDVVSTDMAMAIDRLRKVESRHRDLAARAQDAGEIAAEAQRLLAADLEGLNHKRLDLQAVRAEVTRRIEILEAEAEEFRRSDAELTDFIRFEQARLEAERVAAQQAAAEAARLEAERIEADRLAAEQAEAARLEAERVAAEQIILEAQFAAAEAAREAALDQAAAEAALPAVTDADDDADEIAADEIAANLADAADEAARLAEEADADAATEDEAAQDAEPADADQESDQDSTETVEPDGSGESDVPAGADDEPADAADEPADADEQPADADEGPGAAAGEEPVVAGDLNDRDPGSDDTPEPEPTALPVAPPEQDASLMTWPLPGVVVSGFGTRIHPIYGTSRHHAGLDIDGDMGEAMTASLTGTVISAGWQGGYGNTIVIDHGDGVATLYAHMSGFGVAAGQTVDRGQVIGYVGSTGQSTGPHLHFEVRVNGTAVDPLGFLPAR